MNPEIPAISFISAALSLIPLVWYYQARNVAAVAIGIWLSVINTIYAVDALIWVWAADMEVSIWCDVSTIFITGSRIALPAACLCICIHLERLASFVPTSTPQVRKRRIIFEYLTCFGLPLVYIALHLIVQPRRFDFFYGFGCRPATYPTVATLFLVVIPPLSLTAGTIVFACIAWCHFLLHGVQFYGKKGSVPSLTRNLYLRLVGMALLEAGCSAASTAVVTWSMFSSGLAPFGSMSRHLDEILVWGADNALTDTVRTMLRVEWSLAAIQSFIFFGLFACRMEVLRQGRERIRSFLRMFASKKPRTFGRGGPLEPSWTSSITKQTLPMTEVDLSLVIESTSALSPYDRSPMYPKSSLPSLMTLPPRRPSLVDEEAAEEVVIAPVAPGMTPLQSPSRASAIASSHNSLESNFDPSQRLSLGILSADVWPRTPSTIHIPLPIPPARLSPRSFGMGFVTRDREMGWLEVYHGSNGSVPPFPRAKAATHLRPYTADVFDKRADYGMEEKRHAVYVTVAEEAY